jgi:hypothetical protein
MTEDRTTPPDPCEFTNIVPRNDIPDMHDPQHTVNK